MTAEPFDHGVEHSDRVLLYALRALTSEETQTAEAQISSCPECATEMEMLRPIVASFVSWPTDVLRPAVSLWERIAQRIAADTPPEPLPSSAPPPEPDWEEVAPGIACKLLATDLEQGRVSMLVRLAPGTDYPPHRHDAIEEVYMFDGELIVDDTTLRVGDYRRVEAGSVDRRVWSQTGCTCLLITSFHDTLL
jgi:hypothetical protein